MNKNKIKNTNEKTLDKCFLQIKIFCLMRKMTKSYRMNYGIFRNFLSWKRFLVNVIHQLILSINFVISFYSSSIFLFMSINRSNFFVCVFFVFISSILTLFVFFFFSITFRHVFYRQSFFLFILFESIEVFFILHFFSFMSVVNMNEVAIFAKSTFFSFFDDLIVQIRNQSLSEIRKIINDWIKRQSDVKAQFEEIMKILNLTEHHLKDLSQMILKTWKVLINEIWKTKFISKKKRSSKWIIHCWK